MVSDSVGALHVALAAAVVGWLVFCISHSLSVWKRRNSNGEVPSSRGLLYAGLMLCIAALAAGWLDRELTRRAGVILGTDFFVVHAHARTVPHLIEGDAAVRGVNLATFEDPEVERAEAELKGEIEILKKQIATTHLKPLGLDPELLRLSMNEGDSQRARLSQLGYGVLRSSPQTLKEGELVAAQQAQSKAAQMQFERTAALVKEGIVARAKLDAAAADARVAAQRLRERQTLIQEAKAGSDALASAENAIRRDSERARAERAAEVAELDARLSALRTNLLELHQERSVSAPFAGTVVYRHPTPALAEDGKVILAVAKGRGFVASVQVPAREASMMEPGQQLQLKLKHSLVSEQLSGRLKSVQPVPGNTDRRDLLIECDLPPEQFATFSSGSIPVTLQWRPPLYTDRVMQGGLVFSFVPMIAWFFARIRAKMAPGAASNASEVEQSWSPGWSYLPEEEELHQLGVELGEGLRKQSLSSVVLKRVERAIKRHPAMAAHLVKTGVFKAMSNLTSAHAEADVANPGKEEVDRVLAQLGLSAEDFLAASK
jgi:multidrug resistance efflux pump